MGVGREGGVGCDRFLKLREEQAGMLDLHRRGDAANLPVLHALDPAISAVPQEVGHLAHPAEGVDARSVLVNLILVGHVQQSAD